MIKQTTILFKYIAEIWMVLGAGAGGGRADSILFHFFIVSELYRRPRQSVHMNVEQLTLTKRTNNARHPTHTLTLFRTVQTNTNIVIVNRRRRRWC